MASTTLHLSLECRFGAIWKAPLLLALGWKPLIFPVRPGLQVGLWPIALWYGLIRPKWIKVGTKPVAPEPLRQTAPWLLAVGAAAIAGLGLKNGVPS